MNTKTENINFTENNSTNYLYMQIYKNNLKDIGHMKMRRCIIHRWYVSKI